MKEYFSVGTMNRYRAFSLFGIRYEAGHTAHLPHGTTADTLIIMLQGSIRCLIPGQGDLLLTPDTITCFSKNLERTSVYLEDTHLLSIHVNADSPVFTLPCGQIPVSELDEHAKNCLDTLRQAALGSFQCTELVALSCLYGLLDNCTKKQPRDIPAKYLAVHAAKCAIDSEFTIERPIREYARGAAMSESTFRRLFAEYTGNPPVRYRLLLRLAYVRALVGSGECNLSEASARAGFNSLPYLCRQFKKVYGVSAGELVKRP